MKYLLILLFPILTFAQSKKITPDTCFTQQELADISFVLDSLWAVDDINNDLIQKYNNLIYNQDSLIKLDSVQLAKQQQNIILLKDIIAKQEQQINLLQPKFIDKKSIWFGFGFLTALGTGILINQAIK